MNDSTDLLYETKKKMLAKYPSFCSEIATSPIVFSNDVKTASTDGKKIYLNPQYFANVNEDVRLYLLSHEIFHKKFKHMYRLKDKDGNMRDMDLWNIVCDALVNANLKRDGIEIPDWRVCSKTDDEYGDWVLQYNCEELYEMKKKEKEEQEQNQPKEGNENSEQKQNSDESKSQGDDHSLWEKAFEQQEKEGSEQKRQKQRNKSNEQENEQEQNQEQNEQQWTDIDEREEFEQNREEKREKFKSRKDKTEENIRNNHKNNIELGDIGESENEIDWRNLTRREIEKSDTVWSQRRSIAENNYAYRLEENETEDEAEVMIDVSGSVKLELVKAFLRQLKPLLKESKLRVGCFNEKFWGFVDIKDTRDIDNFVIPKEARGSSAWTEDWDLAVRSFTKKREINKIVFTDGYPCPGNMPKDDLKKENIIWLVYGNKDFRPCCGKVINITEKQLERLNKFDKTTEDYITR